MSFFSGHRDEFDLHDEVAALRKEVASLGRSLSKQGARTARHAQDGASEIYSELVDAMSSMLPAVRAPARRVRNAVQEHPDRALAIAGLATLAVVAAVMWGGRR